MVNPNQSTRTRPNGALITGVSIGLVLVIIVIIQLIGLKHNARFDLTGNKRYSLSPQSLKVLGNLKQDIKAYSFYSEGEQDYETVRDLLKQYQDASPRFRYEFVDLDKNPFIGKKFDVNSYSTTVLEYGEAHRKVTNATEKDFTNAIVKLTRGDAKKKIYFTTFHGERDLESTEAEGIQFLKLGLQDTNYEVDVLNMVKTGTVPDDCHILAIMGPTQDFLDSELTALNEYIQRGGNLAVFIDPNTAPKLSAFFQTYGIQIGNDLIIDPQGYQNIRQPIVNDYPAHEITEEFTYGTIFLDTRTVTPSDPPPEETTIQVLAKTSDATWAERTFQTQTESSPQYDESQDTKGPLSIGVAAEIPCSTPATDSNTDPSTMTPEAKADEPQTSDSPEKTDTPSKAKLVVWGDSEFANNIYVQSFPTNGALIMNIFHWLSEESDLIAIPPKDPISQPMHLSSAQLISAFAIPVVVLPLIILLVGGVRIYDRRKRG